MGRGGQDTGGKKTRKGPKNRKCRKNERSKRECGQPHKTGRRQSGRKKGTEKRVRFEGKDVRRERGARKRASEDVRAQ